MDGDFGTEPNSDCGRRPTSQCDYQNVATLRTSAQVSKLRGQLFEVAQRPHWSGSWSDG